MTDGTSTRQSRYVLVVDDHRLRQAAICAMLDGWAKRQDCSLRGAVPDDLMATDINALDECGLVVVTFGAADLEADSALSIVINRFASRVAMVGIAEREDYDFVSKSMAMGLRGYLPTSTDPDIALSALDFVIRGGTYFPPTALSQRSSRDGLDRGSRTEAGRDGPLTSRQRQVLDLLRQGKPNKVIARELAMRESTVKVHVRQILRKLGAANRTQAAMCANRLQLECTATLDETAREQAEHLHPTAPEPDDHREDFAFARRWLAGE